MNEKHAPDQSPPLPPLPPALRPTRFERLRDYLPFRLAWPILAGVGVGLLLRLVFSADPGEPYSAMAGSFILLAPMLVGIVTVYVAERQARRGWGYYFLASVVANVLFVVGSLLVLIEGWICAILIVPLFSLFGGLGGLLMGAICRWTNWPKQATYSFAALPLLLGMLDPQQAPPVRVDDVQRTILIDAPTADVWRQIHRADDIRPEEVEHGWMYRIGVPLPQMGVTERTPHGRVRHIAMGKGIRFDQVVTDWRPERYVRFEYRFDEDAFPPRALDDHVRIGGHYFDLVDTSYTLQPRAGDTALTIRMRYRVSTQFNWYAEPIAQWLIGDFEDTILGFYRRRSEAAGARAPVS